MLLVGRHQQCFTQITHLIAEIIRCHHWLRCDTRARNLIPAEITFPDKNQVFCLKSTGDVRFLNRSLKDVVLSNHLNEFHLDDYLALHLFMIKQRIVFFPKVICLISNFARKVCEKTCPNFRFTINVYWLTHLYPVTLKWINEVKDIFYVFSGPESFLFSKFFGKLCGTLNRK